MSEKRIMCFGDSLTWGWIPVVDGTPTTRYPPTKRWTGILQKELGRGYAVIEEGLNGRTTSLDDPTDPRLNGCAYLPSALASHLPLDLTIIMLGTNDTKVYFRGSASKTTDGMSMLIDQVLSSTGGVGTIYPAPETLIIAPPPLTPKPHSYFRTHFGTTYEQTLQLGCLYETLAKLKKVHFLDAQHIISTDGVDGVHLTERNNLMLGKSIASKVRSILHNNS